MWSFFCFFWFALLALLRFCRRSLQLLVFFLPGALALALFLLSGLTLLELQYGWQYLGIFNDASADGFNVEAASISFSASIGIIGYLVKQYIDRRQQLVQRATKLIEEIQSNKKIPEAFGYFGGLVTEKRPPRSTTRFIRFLEDANVDLAEFRRHQRELGNFAEKVALDITRQYATEHVVEAYYRGMLVRTLPIVIRFAKISRQCIVTQVDGKLDLTPRAAGRPEVFINAERLYRRWAWRQWFYGVMFPLKQCLGLEPRLNNKAKSDPKNDPKPNRIKERDDEEWKRAKPQGSSSANPKRQRKTYTVSVEDSTPRAVTARPTRTQQRTKRYK